MSYQDKVQKDILYDIKFKRSPRNDKHQIKRIFAICGNCHKNKVTSHHFLCDSCWIKLHSRKVKGGKRKCLEKLKNIF